MGYVDSLGVRQPTYHIYAMRDYLKRMAYLFQEPVTAHRRSLPTRGCFDDTVSFICRCVCHWGASLLQRSGLERRRPAVVHGNDAA